MELLTRTGTSDLAYDIACKTDYPSWGYMIANGATTLWELWQKREGPSMNSHNHPMFGSVGSWLYKALAGINLAPGTTGFEKILIAPQMVRDLTHASGSTMTVRGEVACAWSRTERSVRVEVTVPFGSEAEVVIPKLGIRDIKISEGGQIDLDGGQVRRRGGRGRRGRRQGRHHPHHDRRRPLRLRLGGKLNRGHNTNSPISAGGVHQEVIDEFPGADQETLQRPGV